MSAQREQRVYDADTHMFACNGFFDILRDLSGIAAGYPEARARNAQPYGMSRAEFEDKEAERSKRFRFKVKRLLNPHWAVLGDVMRKLKDNPRLGGRIRALIEEGVIIDRFPEAIDTPEKIRELTRPASGSEDSYQVQGRHGMFRKAVLAMMVAPFMGEADNLSTADAKDQLAQEIVAFIQE